MAKMKVGIIGTGTRSIYFINAIKALSEDFEISSMRFRTQEKANRFKKEYDIPVTTSMDEFKNSKPDFMLCAVGYHREFKVIMDLLEDGFPVLVETPPANTIEDLYTLWNFSKTRKSKSLVAENCFEEPMYVGKIGAAKKGYIGDVQTVSVSSTHEYHAFSIMRIMLDEMNSPFSMIGKKMDLNINLTHDQDNNPITDSRVVPAERYHAVINFANGKTGLYDFQQAQYWSDIRFRYIMAQGTHGEIKDDEIKYADKYNIPRHTKLIYNKTSDGGLISITINDDPVYENTLLSKGIGDNIAPCHMLLNMKSYIETGFAPYPFADAMQDTYMTTLLHECGRRPFELIKSEKMPWQK